MTAKEYLMQIEERKNKIIEQEEYIERLRCSLGIAGIRYDKERVQTSPEPDKTGRVLAKIIDEEDKLDSMKKSLMNFRVTVIDQIRELENENHRKILNVVYVDMHNLKECSHIVGYSYTYVKELHSDALKAFEDMFQPQLS